MKVKVSSGSSNQYWDIKKERSKSCNYDPDRTGGKTGAGGSGPKSGKSNASDSNAHGGGGSTQDHGRWEFDWGTGRWVRRGGPWKAKEKGKHEDTRKSRSGREDRDMWDSMDDEFYEDGRMHSDKKGKEGKGGGKGRRRRDVFSSIDEQFEAIFADEGKRPKKKNKTDRKGKWDEHERAEWKKHKASQAKAKEEDEKSKGTGTGTETGGEAGPTRSSTWSQTPKKPKPQKSKKKRHGGRKGGMGGYMMWDDDDYTVEGDMGFYPFHRKMRQGRRRGKGGRRSQYVVDFSDDDWDDETSDDDHFGFYDDDDDDMSYDGTDSDDWHDDGWIAFGTGRRRGR